MNAWSEIEVLMYEESEIENVPTRRRLESFCLFLSVSVALSGRKSRDAFHLDG